MKAIATNIRLQFNEDRRPEIVLTLQTGQDIADLKSAVTAGKLLSAEIKVYRPHRSLDANGMLWVILGKMAEVLRADKDDVYLTMLERYGQYAPVICKPEAVERLKREWRTVKEIGRGNIGGKEGVQLLCYYGSHTYDSREFSILLDGVISEAKAIGVDTITPAEKDLLLKEWGRRE